jgi:hypothetical protein
MMPTQPFCTAPAWRAERKNDNVPYDRFLDAYEGYKELLEDLQLFEYFAFADPAFATDYFSLPDESRIFPWFYYDKASSQFIPASIGHYRVSQALPVRLHLSVQGRAYLVNSNNKDHRIYSLGIHGGQCRGKDNQVPTNATASEMFKHTRLHRKDHAPHQLMILCRESLEYVTSTSLLALQSSYRNGETRVSPEQFTMAMQKIRFVK